MRVARWRGSETCGRVGENAVILSQALGLGSPVGDEIAIRQRCVYPPPMTDGNIGHRKDFDIYNDGESRLAQDQGTVYLPFL